MTAKCLTHTRHDRGSKLKLLPIPAGIPAGFGRYVPIPTPVHISVTKATKHSHHLAAFFLRLQDLLVNICQLFSCPQN